MIDVTKIEPRITLWANVYPGNGVGAGWATKKLADTKALDTRIACVEINFRQGDGL
jgi:hypothetical protein